MTPKTKQLVTYGLIGIGVYIAYKKFVSTGPGLLGLGKVPKLLKTEREAQKQTRKTAAAAIKDKNQLIAKLLKEAVDANPNLKNDPNAMFTTKVDIINRVAAMQGYLGNDVVATDVTPTQKELNKRMAAKNKVYQAIIGEEIIYNPNLKDDSNALYTLKANLDNKLDLFLESLRA